jgi:hypothetical protein
MTISPTRFTTDELRLICRALNTYGVITNNPATNSEIDDAGALSSRIYRENFRIGMDNEPPAHTNTDSMGVAGTGPFTPEQLFGNQLGDRQNGALIKVCRECGCLSASDTKHVEWHNKVADL